MCWMHFLGHTFLWSWFIFLFIFLILSVKLVLLTLAVCFIPSIFWFICVLDLFWHATSTCRPVKWCESVGRKIHHVSHMFALKYKPNEGVLLKGKKKNLQRATSWQKIEVLQLLPCALHSMHWVLLLLFLPIYWICHIGKALEASIIIQQPSWNAFRHLFG